MSPDKSKTTAYLQNQRQKTLPSWHELPDIELYMDQITGLVNRYLGYTTKERMLTPSMVNNYVKMKVMPAPVKKKYSREHLMYLIVICVLKQVMPLSSVETVLRDGLDGSAPELFYEGFRSQHEASFRAAEETAVRLSEQGTSQSGVLLALAMRAQAKQTLVQELLDLTE